jgi:hypothetical protein
MFDHESVMQLATNKLWNMGLVFDEPENFFGKGSCFWLTETHDVNLCFFVQGHGVNMRCGFLLPDSEAMLMSVLDHQITNLSIPLKYDGQLINHSFNRSSIERASGINRRIYVDFRDINVYGYEEMAHVFCELVSKVMPALATFSTMRSLSIYHMELKNDYSSSLLS